MGSDADAREEAERWARQIRKGSTKLAALQLVSESDRYGYELASEVKARTRGEIRIAEGNLYPALHALEESRHVTSYWQEPEPGAPPRKYYRITPAGRALRDALVDEWARFEASMNALVRGGRTHALES